MKFITLFKTISIAACLLHGNFFFERYERTFKKGSAKSVKLFSAVQCSSHFGLSVRRTESQCVDLAIFKLRAVTNSRLRSGLSQAAVKVVLDCLQYGHGALRCSVV